MASYRIKKSGNGTSPRGWVPFVVILLILVLAPVLAHGQSTDSVTVRWTAPGDDGNIGTAVQYDLRVSDEPIDAVNFGQVSQVTGLPSPAAAGTLQRITVRGLTAGLTYYFAIRTRDDAGNWSPVSNIARWEWVYDTSPPAAPSGVKATRNDQSVHLQWGANSEADLAGYRVYRGTAAAGPFQVISIGLVTDTQFDDTNVPAKASDVYYRVSAVDASNNESAHSVAVVVSSTAEHVTKRVEVEEGYPNPSSLDSPVHIPVVVPASGVQDAYVEILDSGRRRVRRITVGDLSAGRQEIVWDGKNDAGQLCAPGVYRGWFVAGKDRQAIRIVRVP